MRRLAACLILPAIVTFAMSSHAQTASANVSAPIAAAPAAKMSPQQAQLIADTQKLRKLSEELKAEVDKSSKEQLSVAVIKRAQEVEKLARSLKQEISKSH
jgi:uncharacterized protein (DUF1697 family)